MEATNQQLAEQPNALNRNYQQVLRRLPPEPEFVGPPAADDETRQPTGTGNAASGTGGRTAPGVDTGPISAADIPGPSGPPAGDRRSVTEIEGTGGRTEPEETRGGLEPKKRLLGGELDPARSGGPMTTSSASSSTT